MTTETYACSYTLWFKYVVLQMRFFERYFFFYVVRCGGHKRHKGHKHHKAQKR
jgi:hypothetical protein